MQIKHFCSLAALLLSLGTQAAPLGEKPSYLWGGPSSVPNEQAVLKTIWAPGLADGYVPQGLAYAGGSVFVAAYNSTDPKVDKGPCRVFSVAAADGRLQGFFDLPESCGHAGGIAAIDAGTLVVSDTRILYKIDVARALASGKAEDGLLGVVKLAGALKGSFADFDGKDLWVGSSEKSEDKARAYRLSLSIFDEFNGKGAIREDKALASIPIPVLANGMAFDAKGNLWITSSNSKLGELYRLNPADGAILARHEMVIGIEDLGFDEQGRMWSVSEAGTRRWAGWSKTYPLLFQIAPESLK